MKKISKISDAEWEVMSVVWSKFPITANEVVERLAPQKNWHPQTIRTMLSRLVKKKALVHEPQGKRYLYEPQVTKEECVRMESQSFLSRVFEGAAAPMLLHFVKNTRLTPRDIKELKATLAKKEV